MRFPWSEVTVADRRGCCAAPGQTPQEWTERLELLSVAMCLSLHGTVGCLPPQGSALCRSPDEEDTVLGAKSQRADTSGAGAGPPSSSGSALRLCVWAGAAGVAPPVCCDRATRALELPARPVLLRNCSETISSALSARETVTLGNANYSDLLV